MKRRIIWGVLFVVVALIGVGVGFFLWGRSGPDEGFIGGQPGEFGGATLADPTASTVQILPASALIGQLSAAGNIELVSQHQVVLGTDGVVSQIAVQIGDTVAAGDLLIALDDTALKREVAKAEIDFETARLDLEKLGRNSDLDDIAIAKANLLTAQENLVRVKAGATEEELAAARSNLTSAWAKYNELAAGPTESAIHQARATLKKAEVDLQLAQREYDQIAWLPEAAASGPAQDLQKATIDFESAQAAFDEASRPTSQSDLQSALSTARQAEHDLKQKELMPSAAEVADAEAKVTEAEAKLAELQAGSYASDLEAAELGVKKALLDLEEAYARYQSTQVLAPISGTVLEIKVEPGQRGTTGEVVAALADTRQLKLTINVAEVDVPQIRLEQKAEISIDAVRGQAFQGIVEQISPVSQSEQGVVNYPVTIRLTATELDAIRPGMTAVATLENENLPPNSWLVPTNGLQEENGQTTVIVVQGEERTPIIVTKGAEQGDWTVVQSTELREDDEVAGSVSSFVDRDAARIFEDD